MTIHRVRMRRRQSRWRTGAVGLCLGALLAQPACRCTSPQEAPKPDATTPLANQTSPGREVNLAIVGFNYTDLPIEGYSVNSQGGGNIAVSSPTSGGSGEACCLTVSTSSHFPMTVHVKWTRDVKRWCDQDVEVPGPLPANPSVFAVHFFPDGHLEAEITEETPDLRLSLERFATDARKASGNTVQDEKTARCHDAKY